MYSVHICVMFWKVRMRNDVKCTAHMHIHVHVYTYVHVHRVHIMYGVQCTALYIITCVQPWSGSVAGCGLCSISQTR